MDVDCTAFHNRTNANPRSLDLFTTSSTSRSEKKRTSELQADSPSRKRVKLQPEPEADNGARDVDVTEVTPTGDAPEDSEDELAVVKPRPFWTRSVCATHTRLSLLPPSRWHRQLQLTTRPILQSFVSSNKADVLKLHSIDSNSFITLPYAASYSNEAKRGGTPLLAVATEQGVVHVLNTRKRNNWDPEPQRTSFQPLSNGIFDVQWSADDTLIASATADRTIQISSLESPTDVQSIRTLQGHTGTVKCAVWDPTRHGDMLASGGRDGGICIWDLRVGRDVHSEDDDDERPSTTNSSICAPVLTISGAHEDPSKPKPRARKGKLALAAPLVSVTSLLYSNSNPWGLISASSSDGVLRHWDLRLPLLQAASPIVKNTKSPKKPSKKSAIQPSHFSSSDPTSYQSTRRSRGITSLSLGSGPSASTIYALGNDSRIHTYFEPSLAPSSGWSVSPEADTWSYGHENMRTNSFYVRTSVSPCGRWLASGGAAKGSVFLFDISGGSEGRYSDDPWDLKRMKGVELKGQVGEVGAVDWADGMLASCADDGTVRIWRPDVEFYQRCLEEEEEMKWEWCWSSADA